MKKFLLLIAFLAFVGFSTQAHAGVHIGIGLPGVYVGPAYGYGGYGNPYYGGYYPGYYGYGPYYGGYYGPSYYYGPRYYGGYRGNYGYGHGGAYSHH